MAVFPLQAPPGPTSAAHPSFVGKPKRGGRQKQADLEAKAVRRGERLRQRPKEPPRLRHARSRTTWERPPGRSPARPMPSERRLWSVIAMSQTARRLKDLGVVLPKPAAPVANYAPHVLTSRASPDRPSQLWVSGQLPFGPDGKLVERHKGKLGPNLPKSKRRVRRRNAARSTFSPRRERRWAISTRSRGSCGSAASSMWRRASTPCRRR